MQDDSAFNKLCSQFSDLTYSGRSQDNRGIINSLLGEFSAVNLRYIVFENSTKAVLLIHQCCSLIATNDSTLVPKYCHLLTNLVGRQRLQIEGQTLKLVTVWCLKALKDCEESVRIDPLLALQTLLANNPNVSDIVLSSDFDSLISTFRRSELPKVKLLCIQCLVVCTGDNKSYSVPQLLTCAEVFIKYLKETSGRAHDLAEYKIILSCLRGLYNVAIKNQEFFNSQLGLLLGICKSFMTFGIKGIDFLVVEKLVPSVLNMPEAQCGISKEKRGGKMIKKRRTRTSQNKKDNKSVGNTTSTEYSDELYSTSACNLMQSSDDDTLIGASFNTFLTSESDVSDNENGRAAHLDIAQSRIRQASLELLLHCVKTTEKHIIFSYWLSLVPDVLATCGTHHITSCILRDPSPKGRIAALKVLQALLVSCKNYLSIAESSDKQLPFTSFSVMLGSMLKELHRCLSLALQENLNTVLIQVLKCYAALVQATPYHKLPAGIVTKTMRNIKVFITHKDATVQVAALIVFSYILGSEHTVPEMKTALLKNLKDVTCIKNQYHLLEDVEEAGLFYDNDSDYDEDISDANQELPWLLRTCLDNLGTYTNYSQSEGTAAPIKVESLQVLTAMSKSCFHYLIVPYLRHITKALELCLQESYCDLRLHAGRTVDFIGQAIAQNLNITDHSKSLSVGEGLIFWKSLLNKSLIELVLCEEHWVLRAIGCDCLGSIGPHIFEHLPKNQQIMVVTLLVGCSRDEEPNVIAAAIRALAISVVYPTLREDLGFVADVAEAVHRTLHHENLVVRIKSSWSLGNLSDALVLIKGSNSETIPDLLFLRLLEISIKCCNDNTKIKVNAVRALGNLLQLVNTQFIAQKVHKETVNNALNSLVKSLTSGSDMKLRWNCCYAVGSVFKNPVLLTSEERKLALFNSLIELVMNFRNFKVRINAALALSCPGNRELYGQHFVIVWNSLLIALDNTQNVEDFNEYNHCDNLVQQICVTLAHMASLLLVDDILPIKERTFMHLELLQQKMHRTIEHLIPEKSSVLFPSVSHLNTLLNSADLHEESKKTISVLLDVFDKQLL